MSDFENDQEDELRSSETSDESIVDSSSDGSDDGKWKEILLWMIVVKVSSLVTHVG